jgi:hypothetical protein
MDENPYKSPQEAGHQVPLTTAGDAEAKDTIALWITGAICFTIIMMIVLGIQWLNGTFPARP